MKPKSKLLSLLLAICLVAGLMPTTAFAAGTGAIQSGAGGIAKDNKVYFGQKGTTVVPWIALDDSGFLLSEYTIDTSSFRDWGDWGYYNYSTNSNTADSSNLKDVMDGLYNGSGTALFTASEQSAIMQTTLAGNSMYDDSTPTVDAYLFPLSYSEAKSIGWGNNLLKAKSIDAPEGSAEWWLRSSSDCDGVFCVREDGSGYVYGYGLTLGVRPAFNLDLTSVLFTSAAVGGKSANGMDSGLTAIGNYAGNEWKLTLLDKSRDFSISNAAIEGSTVTFSYSNAKTGENEYISAVIENNGEITHYGRILQLDGTESGASGIARLTLPEDVTLSDTTKLYVFNEQYNGGEQDDTKLTDYASAFETVALTVSSDTTASPAALDFGSKTVGYTEAPAAQTVTLTNTGNQNVTVTLPASANYTITAGEGFANSTATLEPKGTATFTVQPNTGLDVGNYAETLTVSGSNGASAQVALSFSVVEAAPDTYILTVNLNGGSGGTTGGEYAEGAVVNIDAGSRSNYRFDGWTSSNGGSFADASSASTTFTMPAADTTITANWRYIGGGGSTTDYYRLTFETNGGSEISSIRRAEYTTIDLTDYTPTREGYEFTGWYADEDLTEKITSIRLIRNTTVYAGWEEIKENPGTGFENPFTDVSENDWFYDDVMFVFINELMIGTSDTTFSPEISTSRAMIAVTLWRMDGEPEPKGANPFTDVENGAWYTEAITWANENGIAEGYDDATFGPNAPINREQMAVMMYRYAQAKGYDTSVGENTNILSYTDALEISEYAIPAMQWACGVGIMEGNAGYLTPQGDATRAQVATMLMRFCENYATTK